MSLSWSIIWAFELGETPEEMLGNLDAGRFDLDAAIQLGDGGLASDPEYIASACEMIEASHAVAL